MSEHRTNPEKENLKKACAHQWPAFNNPRACQRSISPVLTLIAVLTGRTKILRSPIPDKKSGDNWQE